MTLQKNESKGSAGSSRLVSVDALRGFDMFWITCIAPIQAALCAMFPKSAPVAFIDTQLHHVGWEGFQFFDLVFPLFVFIVGVSTVFSLDKSLERDGLRAAIIRIVRRGIVLFLMGLLIMYGGLNVPWPSIRLSGILQHIAVGYVGAGVVYCLFRKHVWAIGAVCVGLLVGYWALMTFVPIRDIKMNNGNLAALAAKAGDTNTAALFKKGENWSMQKNSPAWAAAEKLFYATTNRVSGVYEPGRNVAHHFDFQYLPGRKLGIYCDPQGILPVINCVACCILGLLSGMLLKTNSITPWRKVALLWGVGAAGAGLGWLWGLQFPVIKGLWTSSYVLVAGGYSALLLGVFYLVVDVWQKRAWCQPFIWMGANAITIYLLIDSGLFSFKSPALRIVGGDVRKFLDVHVTNGCGDLAVALFAMVLTFWFLRFLYQRKIFLRV